MVGLELAQARQLPLGLLRLGSRGLGRLLAFSTLGAGGPKILLQLRDPGGSSCKPANGSRQPDKSYREKRNKRSLTLGNLELAGHVASLGLGLVVAGHKPVVQGSPPVRHRLEEAKIKHPNETWTGSKQPAHASEGYQCNTKNTKKQHKRGLTLSAASTRCRRFSVSAAEDFMKARRLEKNISMDAAPLPPSRLVTSQASAWHHSFSMVPAEPRLESGANTTFSSEAAGKT
jgi:hypothetical protein